MSDDLTCPTCAESTGTRRYCALTRCYCGHDTCPAFPSYYDPKTITATSPGDTE